MADGDQYVVPKCDASPHCPVHGIEVERRKNTQSDVKKLEEKLLEEKREYERKIADNEKRIGELLTFKNRMLGLCVLGTLILAGAFIYPSEHIKEANVKYVELEDETTKVSDEVKDLKAELADVKFQLNEKINSNTVELRVGNDRYLQIVNQLTELKRLIQEKQ